MAKRHPSSRRTVWAASPPAFWASTRPACDRSRRSSRSASRSPANGPCSSSRRARWVPPPRPPGAAPRGPRFGALALLHAPLIVPLPSGGGGLEVAFLNGFAGYFGARQVTMLLWWRFYTAILLTVFGVYALVRSVGYHAAVQLFKIGWGSGKRREEPT